MEWRTTKESERYHVNGEGQVRDPWLVLKSTVLQIGYYNVALLFGNQKLVRQTRATMVHIYTRSCM